MNKSLVWLSEDFTATYDTKLAFHESGEFISRSLGVGAVVTPLGGAISWPLVYLFHPLIKGYVACQ